MQYQTIINGCVSAWPELDYHSWSETLKTIHQWTQIVGKIRLKAMPWQNHSWHTTLYITARGFSTGSVPYENGIFEIEFDFESHLLIIRSTFEIDRKISLEGQSVASLYEELFANLRDKNINVEIYGRPNELEDNTPFAENTEHSTYDPKAAVNFWQAAVSIHNVFLKFRSEFVGKNSPVHLFWGAFDIAVTRFSGREAPLHPGGMPNMPLDVMQEAYSQEVSSAGFWPGGDAFPVPIFYSYCYPSPEEFAKASVAPKEAFWSPEMGEFVLKYEDVRASPDPEATLMDFLRTTYAAAADTGNWDRAALEKRS
ncbi:MAG TPA: hypothetical protein DCE41_23120 [Cytophagales bacterium]|nr:hypothetical protein [Cytophagales bacterium]HAA24268.1 hypothetical protein [Cytophagales bacterium]HAP59302.1 hypothetical protein [Cytophagales bacterium]